MSAPPQPPVLGTIQQLIEIGAPGFAVFLRPIVRRGELFCIELGDSEHRGERLSKASPAWSEETSAGSLYGTKEVEQKFMPEVDSALIFHASGCRLRGCGGLVSAKLHASIRRRGVVSGRPEADWMRRPGSGRRSVPLRRSFPNGFSTLRGRRKRAGRTPQVIAVPNAKPH